jgi:hypothetical protein
MLVDLPVLEEDKDMLLSFSVAAGTILALAIPVLLKQLLLLLVVFSVELD